jgi:tight adherence protein B
MGRNLRNLATVLLAVAPMFVLGVAQADDTELTISHVQPAGDDVQILVSVPKGADVDLDGIAVTIDGGKADSEATPAGEDTENQVRRTTILAIDTSDSMQGVRFTAAKVAAETFLENVPGDVYVGIVTFDAEVKTALAPSLDRAAATEVIEGLILARGTRLNDGVISAVNLAGTEGQRSVLVLSDGRNTNKTPLADVESAIGDAEIKVDAVALDQSEADSAPLRAMTEAGAGEVIPANPEALTAAFTAEADSLARQILVTAQIPQGFSGTEATVVITAKDGSTTMRAESFSVVRGESGPSLKTPSSSDETGLQIPREAMYGGLAAIGFGLLVLIGTMMAMATADSTPRTVEQRIEAYGTTGLATGGARKAESNANTLDQAKVAAASMLRHNRGLEARIEQRLEAAGSALKSAEWLLLHGTIAMLSGLVGALVGGGDILFIVLFLAGGIVVPWLWLGRKRSKRIKAFNAQLADTLQLMAGSLSAGMSLAQSIDTVVAEGQEPTAGEFKRVLIEARLGVPIEDALEGIAQRIGSQDVHWAVMAIRIQREVGGNLAELLTTVAVTIREREYLRRQVRSLSAEGRLSGYILGGLPPAMMIYMLLVRREYIMPLFTTGLGLLMLFTCICLLAFGGWIMSRLVKIEV